MTCLLAHVTESNFVFYSRSPAKLIKIVVIIVIITFNRTTFRRSKADTQFNTHIIACSSLWLLASSFLDKVCPSTLGIPFMEYVYQYSVCMVLFFLLMVVLFKTTSQLRFNLSVIISWLFHFYCLRKHESTFIFIVVQCIESVYFKVRKRQYDKNVWNSEWITHNIIFVN